MTTVAPSVADLFGEAITEVRTNVQRKRPKVAVPPAVLDKLKDARAKNEYVFYKLRSAADYVTMANVLYSAGDLMDATILPVPVVMGDDNQYKIIKEVDDTVTHVRVTVALRRGNKKASPVAE